MKLFGSTTSLRGVLLLSVLSVAAVGCSDTVVEPPDDDGIIGAALEEIGTNVILPTYAHLDSEASLLVISVDNFNSNPTASSLELARDAWRNARRPWEQSEGFLFGPVDTKGIDPGIDSWPVNKADLDAVLFSNAVLTKDYIDGLEGTLKGFHTIEYLLFGEGNAKTVAQFTAREREYLTAVTRSFKGATAELLHAWNPSGDNFVAQLTEAGTAASSYASRKSALQEVIDGMVAICDEVATGKIADPYSLSDRSLEESQFSDNSIADFQDNIRSVKNVYTGRYMIVDRSMGVGLLVATKNPALDTRVSAEIDAAIAAIGAMQPSFGQAIFNNRPAVQAAIDAVSTLQATLQGDVLPLLMN